MKYLEWINQTVNRISNSFQNLLAIQNKVTPMTKQEIIKTQGIDKIKEKIVKHKILQGESLNK
jgi:hypothetical protein